jgi:quinolinate synthase
MIQQIAEVHTQGPATVRELQEKILQLKKERNAVILAHNYQVPEIQDIADFVGDSLGLSYQAAKTNADVIVFCGVHFMAETAKIINPDKTVLLPDLGAGCSLSDSCPAEQLEAYLKRNPGLYVVAYINCSAAVKALSDVICTSGNAVKIVESVPKDREILFVPDQNLGQWVIQKTGRKMRLWPGNCYVHIQFTQNTLFKLKQQYPGAKIVAHPECTNAVRTMADHVCSTEGMVKYCRESPAKSFIIVTESGIVHRLKKEVPGKEFIPGPSDTCACNNCQFMKRITIENTYQSLLTMRPQIELEESIRQRAYLPIKRMLDVSAN